jgi:hypothetical protein
VRPLLVQLASRDEGAVPHRVRHAAIRALATLGMLLPATWRQLDLTVGDMGSAVLW